MKIKFHHNYQNYYVRVYKYYPYISYFMNDSTLPNSIRINGENSYLGYIINKNYITYSRNLQPSDLSDKDLKELSEQYIEETNRLLGSMSSEKNFLI